MQLSSVWQGPLAIVHGGFTGGNAKVERREAIKAWNRALDGVS